jgi:hypothetical protein
MASMNYVDYSWTNLTYFLEMHVINMSLVQLFFLI